MKKLLAMLLCAALLGTFLLGCPRVQEPEITETTATAPSTAPTEWVIEATEAEKIYEGVELTFLARWEETATEAAVLTQAAEVFAARTGAEIQILWPGEGEEGDILQLPGSELTSYSDRIIDLTDMADGAGYGEKSFSCLTDQVLSRCGRLAAIPQTPYVSGFYYNLEAFETSGIIRKPRNWEDFLAICTMLVSGGWQPLTLDSEYADDLLLMHLTQYVGREEAMNIAANGGWMNDQALQATVDIFDLVGAGFMARGIPADAPAGRNKIALSNSAIVYGTNALCHQVEEETLTDLEWGMFPYPGTAGAEPVISVDADVLAISAACREPQAAFDFIMLLTTGEFDQLRVDLTVGIPADPGNASAIEGAVEALEITQVLEPVSAELTEKQLETVLKLWKGRYEESDAFAAAMDRLYP